MAAAPPAARRRAAPASWPAPRQARTPGPGREVLTHVDGGAPRIGEPRDREVGVADLPQNSCDSAQGRTRHADPAPGNEAPCARTPPRRRGADEAISNVADAETTATIEPHSVTEASGSHAVAMVAWRGSDHGRRLPVIGSPCPGQLHRHGGEFVGDSKSSRAACSRPPGLTKRSIS